MNSTNVIWTNEDFEEYAKQLQTLCEAYGDAIPLHILERRAADIVNAQKQ